MKAADLSSDAKQDLLDQARDHIGISRYEKLRRKYTEDEIVDMVLTQAPRIMEPVVYRKWVDVLFVGLWGVVSIITGVLAKDIKFTPAIFSAPFMVILLTRRVFPGRRGQFLWGSAAAVVFILSVLGIGMHWTHAVLLAIGSIFAAGVVVWITGKIEWIAEKIGNRS